MKIWINPLNQTPAADVNFQLPLEVWKRLPSIMPSVEFNQDKQRPADSDVQLHLYNGAFDGTPPLYVFIDDVDDLVFPPKHWWPFKRRRKEIVTPAIHQASGVLVSHIHLANAIRDHHSVACPVHVIGHGLPSEVQAFLPADSVTRRITKEVYGREKSFFLAPTTGQKSDNLERLVKAYDLFRQQCPEEVRLLINGVEQAQPKAVRKAVQASPNRADITFLPELSEAEYWKVYSSARAILYPSLSTKFPVEILKAWHAHVPIMAVDNDIMKGAGTLVQGEDFKSMTEGMVSLVTTPFLASGIVENGKRRLGAFSWDKAAEAVAEVLRTADGRR